MTARTLLVKETKSGQSVEIPVVNNSIPATYFSKLRLPQTTPPSQGDTVPLRLYDPGFKNTAVCNTKISRVDPNGSLLYRGYDIETLFENSSFLETAYLLIFGNLPNREQLDEFNNGVLGHTYLHAEMERQMLTFRYDAHPMGMLIATVASLSTFTPDANPAIRSSENLYMLPKSTSTDEDKKQFDFAMANRLKVMYRALGKVPTIAAAVYRHRLGRNYNHPMYNSTSYCENLLYMMDKLNEPDYKPNPKIVKILDKLFIVLAEHGVNCSTVMMRHLASSGVDPYTALSGTAGALFGERKSYIVID
jgi:citrate synthase